MMMKKFFFKRLKYYFLLMLFPTLILLLVSVTTTVRQENRALSALADTHLSNVQQNLDLVISNALYQHDLMSSNPQLNLALQKVLLFSAMDYSDYIFSNSMKAILSSIAKSHPYISSIYLYLDDYTDFFASGKGVCYLDDYYDTSWYSSYLTLPASETLWIESRTVQEFSFEEPREIITVYQRMTYSKGVIVVNIDIEEFREILSSMLTLPQESVHVFNGSQKLLVSTELSEDTADLSALLSAGELPSHKWMRTDSGFGMATVRYFSDFDLYLVSWMGVGAIADKLLELGKWLSLVFLFNCLLIFFLSYETTRRSFTQINHVITSLQNAENGIFPQHGEVPSQDEFGVIMNNVISLFLNTTFLNSQLQEQKYEKEAAQLHALQLQINPHFLFNTLQTLNMEALKLSGGLPSAVNRMIEQLSDILKYSLADPKQPVCLEEEIAYLKKYVSIQNYRFADQFVIYYEVDGELSSLPFMRLLLQPLIENSMHHGIRPRREPGFIKLKIFRRSGRIHFAVVDSGVGMTKERVRQLYDRICDSSSLNIGLTNVNRRLVLSYGPASALRIQSRPGWGTCISFSIPDRGK